MAFRKHVAAMSIVKVGRKSGNQAISESRFVEVHGKLRYPANPFAVLGHGSGLLEVPKFTGFGKQFSDFTPTAPR
jgi:hypothetical protein